MNTALNIAPSGIDSISEKIKTHGGYRYGNLKNYLLKGHEKRNKIMNKVVS
jgi:hypothetical protein